MVTRTPAVWLSADGGVTWTLAPVPVSHGATNGLAGIASDGTGFVAVRPGSVSPGSNAQSDGVVYASADGMSWRYVSTLTASNGVQIGMVAGGPGGFAALGRGPGGYMLGYLSADGLSWRSGISFGPAPASVTGATVTAAGTVLVAGARGAAGSQRPYLALAQPGQTARAVNVAAVTGATVSQLSVGAVAVYGNQRVAVGEAGGLPAVWSEAGGSWSPGAWSSSTGSGASTPSGSGPSASGSSAAAPSGFVNAGFAHVGFRDVWIVRVRFVHSASVRLVDVRIVRAGRGDNSSVRLTRGRRVRDRLSFIRHVGGRSVVWLRVRLSLARRLRVWLSLTRGVRGQLSLARRVRDQLSLACRVRDWLTLAQRFRPRRGRRLRRHRGRQR